MKITHLLPIAAILSACGAPPDDTTTPSDEPLTITHVQLTRSGPPQIEVVTETRAERALRMSPPSAADEAHANIGVLGGGVGGRGSSACSSYFQSVMLELCDNASPGCSTGNLACIYGSPQDAMIPLTSIPRGVPVIGRGGTIPPPGNFYQHVVQYRPNQVGPVFENVRTSFPYIVFCSESAIDYPWWVSAGACASSQANRLGINCLGPGSQFSCTYDSDCCRVGAYCSAGTCVGNGF
ncbi:MAG: hypothetical protein ACXVCV_10360 [Polyangia bacterium]